MTDVELIRAALSRLPFAYAPYSRFYVACALLCDSGKVYTGVNVENASYPAGVCAESNAVFHAVACGERHIKTLAIVGGKDGIVSSFCPLCGICRQVIREFCDEKKTRILLALSETEYRVFTLNDLLPESFGPTTFPEGNGRPD